MGFFDPEVLAALGAHQFRLKRLVRGTLEQDPADFVESAIDTGTVRCRISPEQLGTIDLGTEDQGLLDRTWGQVVTGYGAHLRGLRVGVEALSSPGIFDLREVLGQAEKVETIFFADTQLEKKGGWHWPLRIGFLPDRASRSLRLDTAARYQHNQLIKVVELGTDADRCDLLVVPRVESLDLLGRAGVEVGSALSFDEHQVPAKVLRGLGRRHRLSAIGQVAKPIPSGDRGAYFATLLDELSHNMTLDVALRRAAGEVDGYSLFAHPSYLETTRVTRALDQVTEAIRVASAAGRVDRDEARVSMAEMKDLGAALADVGFLSERDGATVGARAVDRVQPTLDKITDKKAPRYLQAQVYEKAGDAWERRRESFRSGRKHQIRVRVGPGEVDWMQVDEGLDETRLDPQDAIHELQVLLIFQPYSRERALDPTTEIGKLQLPAIGGPSTLATFEVLVPAEAVRVEATIQLLYKNRDLQTASLVGEVKDGDEPASAAWAAAAVGGGIGFVPSRPTQVDYRLGEPPDLYLRRDAEVVVVIPRGGKEIPVPLDGIRSFDDTIRSKLYEAAYGTAQLDTGIDVSPGLDLMRLLAAQGGLLKRKLLAGVAALDEVRSVRVSSSSSAHSLAAELFYDGPPPDDDAELCPAFLAPASHPVRGQDRSRGCSCEATTKSVCPSLFWGSNRTIEREVSRPRKESGRGAAPEPRLEECVLPRPQRILLAASHKVKKDDRRKVLEALQKIDPETVESPTWPEWSELGKSSRPTLLVALPHNEKTAVEVEALEIGASDRLRLDRIALDQYFGFDPERPGPITLLLGCNTAAAEIAYQDFVEEVRRNGSSVVVGTLTTVLGRYAAPAARELARLLVDPALLAPEPAPAASARPSGAGPATTGDADAQPVASESPPSVAIGEVLRRARTSLLRAGNPMALAVVVYGDARWRLAA